MAPLAQARQSFVLEVDPQASFGALSSLFAIALPGSAIGDYDALANPSGTSTLPGLFGGSGNQPVAMDLGLSGDTDYAGPPLGRLVLDADPTVLTVAVRELEFDLLGGGTTRTALTLSIEFETFRTFAPDSLYLGGFPIDLPLGVQSLSGLVLVQSGPSLAGALVPALEPGHYTFALLVPVELSFALEFGGETFPVGPLPLALPLAGELELGADSAVLRASFEFDLAQQIDDPLPGFMIEDLPLPLPTILPPGGTANLLFSASIGSLEVSAAANFDLVASGAAPCGFESYCAANTNSTGMTGVLTASGSPDVADADLRFDAAGLPAGTFGYLVASEGEALIGSYRGHQGILCLTQPFWRMGPGVVQVDGAGMASKTIDFAGLPAHLDFLPGTTWRFQLWFRDQDPQLTWNATQAVRARFCQAP